VSRLAMTIELYLSCLLVYPNHLVCLCHFDHSIPLVQAVTTASLQTIGIALFRVSCTVMVRYEWVWIVGSYPLSSNLHSFHGELVKRVRIPFFFPLLFSIPIDLIRCGLSPWLVALLILFLRFLSFAMASGSKEGESCVSFRLLALPCSSPYMLVPSRP
jgi:hypothetical protein